MPGEEMPRVDLAFIGREIELAEGQVADVVLDTSEFVEGDPAASEMILGVEEHAVGTVLMIDFGQESGTASDVIPPDVETTSSRRVPPLGNQLATLVPDVEIRRLIAGGCSAPPVMLVPQWKIFLEKTTFLCLLHNPIIGWKGDG